MEDVYRPQGPRTYTVYEKVNGVDLPVSHTTPLIGKCLKLASEIFAEELRCPHFNDKDPTIGRILMPATCSICSHLEKQ